MKPDAIVTDLGINDASRAGTRTGPGYTGYAGKIDWLMAQLPTVPVYWTDLPCAIEPKTLRTGCHSENRAVSEARARWSNLSDLNWAGLADHHRGWIAVAAPSPLRVHLDASGQTAWSRFVVGALDTHLRVK